MNLYCQEKREDSMMAEEVGVEGKGSGRSPKLEGSKAESTK